MKYVINSVVYYRHAHVCSDTKCQYGWWSYTLLNKQLHFEVSINVHLRERDRVRERADQ